MIAIVPPRPLIRTNDIHRHPDVKMGIKLLAERGEIYQHGRHLYDLVLHHEVDDHGGKRYRLRKLTTRNVQLILESLATWQRYDGRRKRWVVISPPLEICRFILCHGIADWPFPHAEHGTLLLNGGRL
jgi:hypothetical protein